MQDLEPYIRETPVASAIFAITVITSLYAFYDQNVYGKFMLHPYSVSRGERVWSLITSGLIHLDWMHLFFNMMSYYFFAFILEKEMGSWQFGVLYVASLALSDISTIVKHKEHFWYNSLGASGAVSAVVFSFIMFHPLTGMYLMFIPVAIPAVIFGVLYLFYSAYASKQSTNINHDAHFYGAIAGVIITIIFVQGIVPHFIEQIRGALGR